MEVGANFFFNARASNNLPELVHFLGEIAVPSHIILTTTQRGMTYPQVRDIDR